MGGWEECVGVERMGGLSRINGWVGEKDGWKKKGGGGGGGVGKMGGGMNKLMAGME